MATNVANVFSSEQLQLLNNLPEVTAAKAKLATSNKVQFTIPLTDAIKAALHDKFALDLSASEIPMRWIKGDTPAHVDSGPSKFKNTYLVYLNDSAGEFIIHENSYSITANTGFIFSEGLIHKTQNTGTEPHLLLGPMNEFAEPVGGSRSVRYFASYDGAMGITPEIVQFGYNEPDDFRVVPSNVNIDNSIIGSVSFSSITSWKIAFYETFSLTRVAINSSTPYSNGFDLANLGYSDANIFYLYPQSSVATPVTKIRYYPESYYTTTDDTIYFGTNTVGNTILGSATTSTGITTPTIGSESYSSVNAWKIQRYHKYTTEIYAVNGDPTQSYNNGEDMSSIFPGIPTMFFVYADPSRVLTITYYENKAAAEAGTTSIATQYNSRIVDDTPNITFTNTAVYNRVVWWTILGTTDMYNKGTVMPAEQITFYPAQFLFYYPTFADASAANGNQITLQDGSFIITSVSDISSWRIAKYISQAGKSTNTYIPGPIGIYQSGEDLYSVLNNAYSILIYPAVNSSAVITYYATFSDAVNENNVIADQSGYVIDTSTNRYDPVAYFSTRLWRMARYYDNATSNWIAGPPSVFPVGFDLSTLGYGDKFSLYPIVPCFLEGTNILCQIEGEESYVPIETLRKGALVKTTNGEFKRIELIAKGPFKNPGHSERIEERLYKCSRANYLELKKDLYMTGCHSILVDELTDDEREKTMKLCNDIFVTDTMYRLMTCLDDRAEPWTSEGEYTVWHLALENEDPKMNYGIYANGLLVESCAINFLKNKTNMTIV